MKVNIENCIKQAARVLRRKGDEGGYAYMLEEELLSHLKELRDDPAKHGEFFDLYRFSDGKDPAAPVQGVEAQAPGGLVWSREKPKVDGFYWFRVPGQEKQSIDVFEVKGGKAYWYSAERRAWVPCTVDLEFAGPIPEPEAAPGGPTT
jgi:hypothetical protein